MTAIDHPADGLTGEDRLKLLVPGWLYYRHKIGKEARKAEPELLALGDMVRRGCLAIDIGANRGIYSYALARYAARVEAFEPNSAIAGFARAKLGARVRVHEIALSDREGTAAFYVPRLSGQGQHLLGNLRNTHPSADLDQREVRTATLDSFGFTDVGFIKIDVEGSEFEVIAGARDTIMRNRPNLLVELLNRPVPEVSAAIDRIEAEFGCDSWIHIEQTRHPARAALAGPRAAIKTWNVLFTPR